MSTPSRCDHYALPDPLFSWVYDSWGQSAGAISVSLQMLAFGGSTGGLFRGAFMQSGAPVPIGDLTGGQVCIYRHAISFPWFAEHGSNSNIMMPSSPTLDAPKRPIPSLACEMFLTILSLLPPTNLPICSRPMYVQSFPPIMLRTGIDFFKLKKSLLRWHGHPVSTVLS